VILVSNKFTAERFSTVNTKSKIFGKNKENTIPKKRCEKSSKITKLVFKFLNPYTKVKIKKINTNFEFSQYTGNPVKDTKL